MVRSSSCPVMRLYRDKTSAAVVSKWLWPFVGEIFRVVSQRDGGTCTDHGSKPSRHAIPADRLDQKYTHLPGGVVGGGDEAVVGLPVAHGLKRLLHRVEALDVGPQEPDGRLQLLLFVVV